MGWLPSWVRILLIGKDAVLPGRSWTTEFTSPHKASEGYLGMAKLGFGDTADVGTFILGLYDLLWHVKKWCGFS